jgi:hypothetical protein
MRLTKNIGTKDLPSRWQGRQLSEVPMLMQAFLLTPYLAIASSLALAATVAAICCSHPFPRRSGFTV